MRTIAMGCGGGGRGWGPFYRAGEGEARQHRGGESMGAKLVQESEGGLAVLRFGSIRVREGGHRWHATR
jgi:hypothetical protein